ncbi:phage tail tape measure protein [Enterococcus hirae]|uniref:phage tail tape measure protein n=1 Tax=Enterococcus hirae TaxID=1354 RepID=UPI002073CA46|nr:phage tail tape measure protein [Enterococcus hirae]EMF0202705.1 phage tail tape measure protein [Enterococcus hirae]
MAQGKSVTAILAARDNGFTRTMDSAVSSLKRFKGFVGGISGLGQTVGSAIDKLGSKISTIGGTMETIGKKSTKALTIPIATGIGAAIKSAVTFDNEIQSMGALLDDGSLSANDLKKQLSGLSDASKKWSQQYGVSTSAINDGMAELIKKGYTYNQVLGAMPSILDASKASGEDFNLVMNNSTAVLEQFGLKADSTEETLKNTQRVTDSLTYVANATAAGFSDMGEAMKYVGPVANTAGFSMEETAAAIGLMSNNGIEGSIAGTALRGALTRLLKPSKQNIAGFEQLGISVDDFKNGTLTLPDILDKIKANTEGWTDAQKAAAIATAFGTEAQSGMNVLVHQGGDALRELTEKTRNATGYTKGIADVMNNTAAAKVEKFKSSLNILSITFGEKLLPIFTPAIEKVTDLINKFSELDDGTQKNILKWGALIAAAGPVLQLFGKLISGVGKFTSFFGKSISTMFEKAGNIDSKWKKFIVTPIKNGSSNALQAVKGFVSKYKANLAGLESAGVNVNLLTRFTTLKDTIVGLFPTLDTFGANLRASQRQLNMLGEGNKVTNFFRSFSASLQLSNSKLAKFASTVINPVGALRNLSTSAGKSGTVLSGLGVSVSMATKKIGSGFKMMSFTAIRSIFSLTGAMLSNPITAILLVITTTIVGVVQAWKSNFMNIQGYVKTAFGGIVKSLKSVIPNSKSVTKTIKGLGNIFKWLGTGTIVGVTFAIAGFVDGLRAIITVGKTAVNAIMAIANGVKGLWQRLKGDSKGADKSFKDVKKSLSDIGKDWDTMFSDSALKKAAKSTEELGEKSKDTTKAISMNMEEVSNSVENYSSKLDEAKQAMTELFSQQNGSTAGVEAYFKNTLDLVTNLKEQQKKAVETYNKQIEAAEGKSEAEKQKIYANASTEYMKAVQSSNSDLLKVYTDYSNQLKNNKTVEGQELTEQQRATLQNQTNIIRDQLLQQNQQFVEAGVNKLNNNQVLNEQEKEQTLSSLRTLGEIQAQQVQENNAQIQQLETQKNQAKTESEKAAFQNQITQLQTQNSQIRQNELEQGAQLLAIISQNGANKISVTADNLAQLKGVTDQQLLGIYQSYVNNGASIDQQMALLAGMLRQRGIDGSNGLVQGLQSNDPKLWANMSKNDIVNTLQALPPDLFKNGQDGKNKLVEGLNSGRIEINNVGKELMNSMNTGVSSQKSNSERTAAENSSAGARGTRNKDKEHEQAGKGNAESKNKGVRSKKSDSERAGAELGSSTVTGIRKKAPEARSAGKTLGDNTVQGILSQVSPTNNAGKDLGNAVKSGAGSISLTSVGSNMAKGVASGIRASQGEAVSAMQNLVAAVNAEAQKKAKIKSPSRLLKYDVGVFLAQGVAAGIREDTSVAVQSARDMISSIHQSITGSRLMKRSNAIEVKHSIDNTPMGKMVEILEEMRHLTVVMDTGQVVGALGSPMNLNLAEQQKQDRRYRS